MTSRRRTASPSAVLAAAFLLVGAAAQAQPAANPIGSFRDWNAFVSNTQDGKMCFIASQPTDMKYSQPVSSRGDVFFMITTVPSQNVRTEVSAIAGFTFDDDSKVNVTVDGREFTFFTSADAAWIEAPADEPALVDAMRRGRTMVVESRSKRGTVVTDTYSLSGVTAALEAITKECAT